MQFSFDTYSKHSTAYKQNIIASVVFGILLILTFSGIFVLGYISDHHLSPSWYNGFKIASTIIDILLVTSLFIFIITQIRLSKKSYYIKDGTMIINENCLFINSVEYDIYNIAKIEFKIVGYYRERRGKNGLGNKVTLYDTSNKLTETFFAMNSKVQFDSIKTTLIQWKNSNIKFKINWSDFAN